MKLAPRRAPRQRRAMRTLLLAGLVAAAAACGPKHAEPVSAYDVDDPRAGETVDAAPPPVADAGTGDAVAIPPPVARTGVVGRGAVTAVLDASPAAVLRGIEVTAIRPGGTFQGWQLVRILAPASPFASVDVQPGDVLKGINGHALETPQDLSALWQELYEAGAIEATVERNGRPFVIRYEIKD